MDLFEARSDRGLERRVDEGDLRNLYRAGFLHLDSPVRRSGSPNWFRVDEIFPHFEQIPSAKKYSANIKSPSKSGLQMALMIVVSIVAMIGMLLFISQRFSQSPAPQRVPSAQH